MLWLKRLEKAMDYIEEHLEEEISLEELGKITCCSPFHFQRIFSCLTELSLAQYIRRRRMTKAAADLQAGEKVLDVALKYGYDSPTSFSRAFSGIHGIPPSAAKAKGAPLKAFPRICFQIQIKGDTEMNYRIEERESFRIIGKRASLPSEIDACMQEIPLLWEKLGTEDSSALFRANDTLPRGILGVCTPPKDGRIDYYIAAASSLPAQAGMEEFTIPACTWAIFPCTGSLSDAIQELLKRITAQWLPSSGYDYADAPDIELYFEDSGRCEIWIPVVKRA